MQEIADSIFSFIIRNNETKHIIKLIPGNRYDPILVVLIIIIMSHTLVLSRVEAIWHIKLTTKNPRLTNIEEKEDAIPISN